MSKKCDGRFSVFEINRAVCNVYNFPRLALLHIIFLRLDSFEDENYFSLYYSMLQYLITLLNREH